MVRNKSNNFLEFLQTDRFYNEIHRRVFGFACRNKDGIVLDFIEENASRIKFIEEDDIKLDFKAVYIDSKDESSIDFELDLAQ